MNTKVSSEPLKQWWHACKERENKLAKIDMLIFVMAALPLNPQVYQSFISIAPVARQYGANDYGVTALQAIFFLVCGFGLLLVMIGISNSRKAFSDIDREVWAFRYNSGNFPKLKVNLKVMQASKILSENAIQLFQNSKKPQVLYQVAETNEYITSDHVFGSLMVWRLLPILSGLLIINFIVYSMTNSVIFMGAVYSFFILGLLIMVDAIYSLMHKNKQKKKLMEIATKSALAPNKIYCEYDLLTACVITAESDGELLFKGDSVLSLLNMKEARHPVVEDLLCALDHLIKNSYVAIYYLNNDKNHETNKANNTKRFNDINQLRLILDTYVPDVLLEIRNSLTVSNIVTHYNEKPSEVDLSTADIDIIVAYKELRKDILKQNSIVIEMQNYYQSATKSKVIDGLRGVIDRQAKGWQASNSEQSYSLKTSVLNKNLNKELVPALQALLVNTEDDTTKSRIENKISEINTFFNEQVEIDKKAASSLALNYNRNDLLDTNSQTIPTQEAVNAYLTKVDFYVDALKRDW